MRKLYDIERRKRGDDIDIDSEWNHLATVSATRRPATGTEYVASQQVTSRIPERFRFRWSRILDDMTTADRITRGGVVYEITSVNNHNDRWLEIHAVRST